jgi:peroxiredoxin
MQISNFRLNKSWAAFSQEQNMARIWIFVGCLGIGVLLAVQVSAQEKAQDKKANQPGVEAAVKAASKDAASEKPAAKAADDEYGVPEGSPRELVAFIKKLENLPEDDAARKQARAAMLKAAEKILAGKPDDDELDFAVEVKTNLLDKPEDVAAFSEGLKKSGHDRQARAVLGRSLEIGLRNAVLGDKPELAKKRVAAVLEYFKQGTPQPSDLGLAIMTGEIAELEGDKAYAANVYRELGKVFTDSKNQNLADFGKRMEGVVRRLSLVGSKMKFEGKLLSGEAMDLSKYEGKVVLVEFWVSWRKTCADETAKLRKLYDQYHDRGFEIIGFACDYQRKDAEKFAQENQMPWPTVYGENGPSPTFEYYGVMTFPTGILIGKDGKVAALNVTADQLGSELGKLLGEAK